MGEGLADRQHPVEGVERCAEEPRGNLGRRRGSRYQPLNLVEGLGVVRPQLAEPEPEAPEHVAVGRQHERLGLEGSEPGEGVEDRGQRIGVVPLATGFIGVCPLYVPFRIDTRKGR